MAYLPETEFDPDKYVRIPSVAVFKEHERVKGGRSIKVTRKDLQQIADNHNQKFRLLGVGVPLSYGHTLDGDDVLEENQPELLGFCVNFSVDKLPTGEDALFGDFYLPKNKADWILDNLPTRSVEYFPNSQRLHPIALLKTSAPELDLPVIRYTGEDAPYRFTLSDPIPYSEQKQMANDKMDCKKDEKDEDKKKYEDDADTAPMEKAKKDATQGEVSKKSELADLTEKVDQLMAGFSKFLPLLEQLEGLMDEEGADPMKPAEAGPEGAGEEEAEEPEKPMDKKPEEKDSAKKVEGDPVKFMGMPSTTNTSIPSDKKEDYKMNDEAVKYKKEVETLRSELAKYKQESAKRDAILNQLAADKKLNEAKEYVRRLEDEEMVAYASDEVRQADVALFAKLDSDAAENYFKMAKDRYQKKAPATSGAAKYQAQEAPIEIDQKEFTQIADEAVRVGKTFAEVLKQRHSK